MVCLKSVAQQIPSLSLRRIYRSFINTSIIYVLLIIYSFLGDIDAKPQQILTKVNNNFKINLNFDIQFVYLNQRKYILANLYPYFTLLGQSLGSILLAFEAINKCVPNVFIDSMGYSFTFPIFRYLGDCRVGAYVHYPTISTDMLEMVSNTVTTYNNRSFISNSLVLTKAKLLYYKLFAYLYGVVGRMAHVVVVNSSWTQQHIKQLWSPSVRIVYPPCNTTDFKQLPLEGKNELQIVSIGQIRPEKNHALQLTALKEFIEKMPSNKSPKLIIIGSCRDCEDENRVKELYKLCDSLNIRENVEFKLNVSYEELKRVMSESSIGLHTMINEHFGIGVVECLAAGLITVAHDSGGPKMDIIIPNVNGFLASDSKSFSDILYKIVNMDSNQIKEIRTKARESVDRFSEEEFENTFLESINYIL